MSATPIDGRAFPDFFSPGKIGPLTLRNRTIKAATFEGRSDGALVTDSLIEFHRRHAAGGAGRAGLGESRNTTPEHRPSD